MQGVKLRPMTAEGMAVEGKKKAAALTIDGGEPPEKRIEMVIRENPVVVFSQRSCCMCHVIKRLLAMIGVHPTVIELEEGEAAPAAAGGILPPGPKPAAGLPTVFIGGASIGGLEALMALHLSGRLVPRLQELGALWG